LAWFIYRIQPIRMGVLVTGLKRSESRIVSAHFRYLKQLVAEGKVLLAGRTTNTDYSSFGIVVFKARSEKEAADIVAMDPGVKNGVFRAELFPFRLALLGKRH